MAGSSNRRKNEHPKRAENVKTVVVVRKGDREEEGEEDDAERLLRILTCMPCGDDVVEQNQMRKEETAIITKGVKRKRGGHECDVCEKRFTQSSSLKAHMLIHTNEKPYECDVCEKSFTQASNLKRHKRIHTNEMFECDVCEKRFTTSGNLRRHMRTQH